MRTASPLSLALVKALGQIGTSAAVDPLLAAVRDGGADNELRIQAAEAAATTGDEFVVPVLIDLVAGGRRPRDQLPPWLRARLLGPLARAVGPDRVDEVRALLGEGILENAARAQLEITRACARELSCYAKLLADPDPVRAEKAAWAIGLSGDRAGALALVGAVSSLADLPAARYPVHRAALLGLTRLADQRCQACRDKLRQQIEVDNKLVHEPGEKALLRETRLVLAYLDHKAPAPTPVSPN
jgi:HEAT repeat protein